MLLGADNFVYWNYQSFWLKEDNSIYYSKDESIIYDCFQLFGYSCKKVRMHLNKYNLIWILLFGYVFAFVIIKTKLNEGNPLFELRNSTLKS